MKSNLCCISSQKKIGRKSFFGGEYRKAGFEKACKKVGVLGWKEPLRNIAWFGVSFVRRLTSRLSINVMQVWKIAPYS